MKRTRGRKQCLLPEAEEEEEEDGEVVLEEDQIDGSDRLKGSVC